MDTRETQIAIMFEPLRNQAFLLDPASTLEPMQLNHPVYRYESSAIPIVNVFSYHQPKTPFERSRSSQTPQRAIMKVKAQLSLTTFRGWTFSANRDADLCESP